MTNASASPAWAPICSSFLGLVMVLVRFYGTKSPKETTNGGSDTVYSKNLEHGCRMIDAISPSFFGLGSEGGPVPTFWQL